ncbi:Fe-S cluster assembly protein SufD [Lunatimonas salinarum]|uniref:Fe-S cluster assembly protein SufD n=1 Tax=Lunatimonas salinarum TaxID=1774590 RepID=UPI001AE0A723|nr:Fe-S cluster assembly protein SufD [Lunatimonas salinarum]
MTTTLKKTDTLASSFLEAFYSKKPDSPWTELVVHASGLLREHGLPAPKSEEYKFTAISRRIEARLKNLAHAPHAEKITAEDLHQYLIPGVACHLVVLNNGRFDRSLSSFDEAAFTARSFSEGEIPVELGTIAKAEKDPFAALNQLAFQDGLYIDIPANTSLAKPIYILQLVSVNDQGETVHPRLFIRTGKHAEATFIEQVVPIQDNPFLLNTVTEISLGHNSHVHYYKLQDEGKESMEVSNTEANITQDGTFTSVVISLQGQMIRNNLSLNLLDSNTVGNMYGLYLLNGGTHVDNHTNVDHIKPHAESNELYKGILADKSRGVFNGKIFVRQDAQKTNAFQQNNNILLSEDAVINTKPQLEIWADDVKCSHGCTTGQLDEEALFYLRARGISKEAGKALLLYAFAGEVLDHIQHDDFREYCINLVQNRLGSNYAS